VVLSLQLFTTTKNPSEQLTSWQVHQAASATVEQLETTFMSQLAVKMQSVALNLWNLVLALLNSRENRC
jgi:hypothetical protein